MHSSYGRLARLLAVAAFLGPPALVAQGRPLVATGIQDVSFGTVLPGVAVHVLRTDPLGSGQFTLRGTKDAQVLMQFTLPTVMTRVPGPGTMPITFLATDGGFSPAESIASQISFDPRAPALGNLSNNGRATIFLGSTASPAPTQAAGSYSATITLTVSYTGL